MTTITIFAISGGAIVLLTATKRFSNKKGRPFYVLELISRGDAWVRSLRHHSLKHYEKMRDKSYIETQKKRAQMQTKNYTNKIISFCKVKISKYIGNIRNSKLLNKKPVGISEYLKNMSNIEKGNGAIHDEYSQEEEDDLK